MFTHPERGLNSHKQYFFSTIILLFSIVLGAVSYELTTNRIIKNNMSENLVQLLDNIGITVFCLVFLIGLFFSIRFIHQRPIKTLITDQPKIRWKLILIGFVVILLSMISMYSLAMLITPQQFNFNGIDNDLFLFIILSAILAIPIQTTLEELFFRGFLLQWFAKFFKSNISLGVIITILFSLMHLWNPEMNMSPILVAGGYIIMSIAYTTSAIILRGTEFTIGAHAANNMLLMIFFLFDENALMAPISIWSIEYSLSVFIITIYGMNLLWLGFVLIFRKKLLTIK